MELRSVAGREAVKPAHPRRRSRRAHSKHSEGLIDGLDLIATTLTKIIAALEIENEATIRKFRKVRPDERVATKSNERFCPSVEKSERTSETALLGVPDVARITGLDEKSVRKAVEAKQIPALRIGRVWRIPRWWVNEQLYGAPKNGFEQ